MYATIWLMLVQLYVDWCNPPASKVHGANMGPFWGRQDPGGPHVGPMNFAIWAYSPRVFVNTHVRMKGVPKGWLD